MTSPRGGFGDASALDLRRARGFAAGAGASSALLFLLPRGLAALLLSELLRRPRAAGAGLLSELLRRARAGDAFLAALAGVLEEAPPRVETIVLTR